jgi:hypothetical protein
MRNRLIRSSIGQRQASTGLRAVISYALPELDGRFSIQDRGDEPGSGVSLEGSF